MAAPDRWFEDFRPGDVAEFSDYVMTEDEIIEFGRRFDPQPFHVDPDAARASAYGGLIASGWHTTAVMMRMLVDHFVPPRASLGSPGIEEIGWTKPVRPGDRLRVRVTITDCRRSRSKPDRGIVRTQTEILNQAGECVMVVRGLMLFRSRPA